MLGWLGAAIATGLIIWRWNALLIATLNPDLAVSKNIDVEKEQLVLMLSLAILVACAIKLVGALLITAILIIPAATARAFSKTPEQMAVGAVLAGLLSVALGLWMSLLIDSPSGPSIVVVAGLLFAIANLVAGKRNRRS